MPLLLPLFPPALFVILGSILIYYSASALRPLDNKLARKQRHQLDLAKEAAANKNYTAAHFHEQRSISIYNERVRLQWQHHQTKSQLYKQKGIASLAEKHQQLADHMATLYQQTDAACINPIKLPISNSQSIDMELFDSSSSSSQKQTGEQQEEEKNRNVTSNQNLDEGLNERSEISSSSISSLPLISSQSSIGRRRKDHRSLIRSSSLNSSSASSRFSFSTSTSSMSLMPQSPNRVASLPSVTKFPSHSSTSNKTVSPIDSANISSSNHWSQQLQGYIGGGHYVRPDGSSAGIAPTSYWSASPHLYAK